MPTETPVTPFHDIFSRRARNVADEPLLAGMDRAGERISFTFGFPDPASLPAADVAAATVRTLEARGRTALQYGDNAGYAGLIDALLAKLARDQGIHASRANVLITAGGSQALDLLLDTFVDWGDPIISEMPAWLGGVDAFLQAGVDVLAVPIDSEGADVGAIAVRLSELASQGRKPKFIYVIPNFQNPTGVTMSLARRRALLDVARAAGVLIVEDDAYFDLRYDGVALPSLYSLDDAGIVIYMGTLSKTMGPGMRLGWLIGPPPIIRRITALKVDGGTNVFGAHVAADWLPENLLPHVDRLRAVYRQRRDLMLSALERYMPPGTTWSRPEGGFFIWVSFPEGVNTEVMRTQAQELGVDFLPGPTCFADRSGLNQLRLSFSFAEDDLIERGIRIIADIAASELRELGARQN